MLDDEGAEYQYVHEGPLPDVRSIANRSHEAQLLAAFFKQAIVHFRLTIGSCAVLCPNEGAGKGIAAALQQQRIQATYMAGRELDLKQPGVKVITLKSSKGLEFPIVALAGFVVVAARHRYDPAFGADARGELRRAGEGQQISVPQIAAGRVSVGVRPMPSLAHQQSSRDLVDVFPPRREESHMLPPLDPRRRLCTGLKHNRIEAQRQKVRRGSQSDRSRADYRDRITGYQIGLHHRGLLLATAPR